MTAFIIALSVTLNLLLGVAVWMYFGATEAILDELAKQDVENDHLVGIVMAQQEAIQSAHEATFIS